MQLAGQIRNFGNSEGVGLSRKNILVVDDELLIRDLLYDFFSEKDWMVSVHESASKALEAMRGRKFDIALIDLKMPEIDGISLVKKIRDYDACLPVVIMTAFPSVESAIEALRLRVEDYIIKPFNINKLFKSLSEIAEQKHAQVEPVRSEDVQF